MAPSRHIMVAVLVVLWENSHRGTQCGVEHRSLRACKLRGWLSDGWLLKRVDLGDLALRQGGPVWAGRECGV